MHIRAIPRRRLRRQSQRELHRAVLELRSSGFSDEEIQAHQNELRQNSQESTAKALKEHFILERIAEDQDIDAEGGARALLTSVAVAMMEEDERRAHLEGHSSTQARSIKSRLVHLFPPLVKFPRLV